MHRQIMDAQTHTTLATVVSRLLAGDTSASGETYAETAARYDEAGRGEDAALLRLAEARWYEIE